MPPRKKRNSAPPPSVADRIGALPDSMLHHVLSFLPVQAAVRTCVLARRWRHLWRSTTGLRIAGLDDEEPVEFQQLRKFMDHLLILRDRTDLDTVEIKLGEPSDNDDVEHYVKLWIRFAVMCKVRVLSIDIYEPDLYLGDLRLVSQHLRTLHVDGIALQGTFLDFASCPSLEDLKIAHCNICDDDFSGRTPFLENMALLETAAVYLGPHCEDVCLSFDSGVFCGANNNACENCVPIEDDCSSDCVLLGGISSARHLKLLSESGKFVFTRDLKCCPTFSKLKTLLLNEYWCEAPNLDPLTCILKNSPVLEKLTLQLFSKGPNHKVEMKGHYCSMEGPSAISEHLNIVEVKCNVVDERILKVLKFMSAFDICFSF